MPTFQVTRRIDAPADAAWRRLSAVTDWPAWLPTVTAVTAQGEPALRVGARFEVRQPKLQPTVYQVTALEPGTRFTWESRSPGIALWADHVVRAQGANACEVTLVFRFSGPLAGLVGVLAGGLTRRYIETEAASLKALVEAPATREGAVPVRA